MPDKIIKVIKPFQAYIATRETEWDSSWLAIWGVGTVASASLGHKYSEEIDRRKAINRIKEERRTSRKQPRPKRKFLPGVVIGLSAVSAAILIIGIAGD